MNDHDRTNEPRFNRNLQNTILLGVAGWGVLLAIGVLMAKGPIQSLFVLGSFGAFLGVWYFAQLARRVRPQVARWMRIVGVAVVVALVAVAGWLVWRLIVEFFRALL